MAKRVTTIQPTLTRFTAVPITEQRRRKVAAYARVSTDHEEQQSSYEAQLDYYTNFIRNHDGWEFVNVYADEGILFRLYSVEIVMHSYHPPPCR